MTFLSKVLIQERLFCVSPTKVGQWDAAYQTHWCLQLKQSDLIQDTDYRVTSSQTYSNITEPIRPRINSVRYMKEGLLLQFSTVVLPPPKIHHQELRPRLTTASTALLSSTEMEIGKPKLAQRKTSCEGTVQIIKPEQLS